MRSTTSSADWVPCRGLAGGGAGSAAHRKKQAALPGGLFVGWFDLTVVCRRDYGITMRTLVENSLRSVSEVRRSFQRHSPEPGVSE